MLAMILDRPGHQIVGVVERVGALVRTLALGDRVGVPWLGWTCETCDFCSRPSNLGEPWSWPGST